MLELKVRKIGNAMGVVLPKGSGQPAARGRGRSPFSDRGAEWCLSINTLRSCLREKNEEGREHH